MVNPNTSTYNVKFIHIEGLLIIDGDFGRWAFARDFNPAEFENCGVSDIYWCEKIEQYSEQKAYVFDTETAENSIKEKIKELQESNDPIDGDEELIDFWNDLLNYCDNEFELNSYFRNNKPYSLDYEDFPCCEKQNRYLDSIFDAFEEIMNRYKNDTNGTK